MKCQFSADFTDWPWEQCRGLFATQMSTNGKRQQDRPPLLNHYYRIFAGNLHWNVPDITLCYIAKGKNRSTSILGIFPIMVSATFAFTLWGGIWLPKLLTLRPCRHFLATSCHKEAFAQGDSLLCALFFTCPVKPLTSICITVVCIHSLALLTESADYIELWRMQIPDVLRKSSTAGSSILNASYSWNSKG